MDGTGQTLPREDWIGRAFGFHQNQHDKVPSTRILLTYDLLNRMASPRGPIPSPRSGLIKRWLPTLFLDSVQRWRARTKVLLDDLLNHLEPYRPRPSRVRLRRIMRSQDRHIYCLPRFLSYRGT